MAKINELDKLIEQVLSEVSIDSAEDIKFDAVDVQGSQTNTAVFKKLARIKDPKGKLKDDDFEFLRANPELIDTDIERKLIALVKGLAQREDDVSKQLRGQAIQTLQAKKGAIEATAAQDKTVSAPRVGKPQSATRGVYGEAQLAILDRVMKSAPKNITARVAKVTEISKKYFDAAQSNTKISGSKASIILSEIMLLDMLAFIVKDVDAGAGAYLFEYFLAYISGGEVKGKDPNTPSGQMGATDFTDSNGNPGSAKYYSTGSNIKQAKAGFNLGTNTTYVVALKKQGEEQRGKTSRGASNPDRIIGLDIYTFIVNTSAEGKHTVDKQAVPEDGNNLVFDSVLRGLTPTPLYLAEVYTQTFREMLNKSITNTKPKIQAAYAEMTKFYDAFQAAEEESRIYIAEGDATIGIKVLEKLEASETHFKNMADNISGVGSVKRPTPSAVTETSLSELDKLIAEVLK